MAEETEFHCPVCHLDYSSGDCESPADDYPQNPDGAYVRTCMTCSPKFGIGVIVELEPYGPAEIASVRWHPNVPDMIQANVIIQSSGNEDIWNLWPSTGKAIARDLFRQHVGRATRDWPLFTKFFKKANAITLLRHLKLTLLIRGRLAHVNYAVHVEEDI